MRKNPYGKHLEKYALERKQPAAALRPGFRPLLAVATRWGATHAVPLGPYIGSYNGGRRKWRIPQRNVKRYAAMCKPEVRAEWAHALKRVNAIKAALQESLRRCPSEPVDTAIAAFIYGDKSDPEYQPYFLTFRAGYLGYPCDVEKRDGGVTSLRDGWYHGDDEITEMAFTLWSLTQLVGFPSQSLISALQAEPRRALSFCVTPDDLSRLPPDAATRFASVLFSTWSVQKALRAAEPQIPGFSEPDLDKLRLPEARKIIAGDPNWRTRYPESIQVRSEEFRRLPLATVRKLVSNNKFDLYREMYITIPKISATLAETIEGRRLIRARNLNDVQAMLKAHDTVYAPALRVHTAKKAERGQAKRETWHAKAAKLYKFPPGVRPLVTRADFLGEHKDMEHCIDTYWYTTTSHCFSFTAPDGTRATLELKRHFGDRSTKRAEVVQFYGQENKPASPACRQLLAQFIAMNPFDYARDS